jgi:exopolyphosphatase/guanosine-5'-triphosphate,3'-diphosphate pyrophosphatase
MKPGRRCAVLDIGTNSALLLAAEADDVGAARVLMDRCSVPGLGRGAAADGKLAEASMERTLTAAQALLLAARRQGVDDDSVLVTGTAALRRAPNRGEFADRLLHRSGVALRIIDGSTEAEWSARAVVGTLPAAGARRAVDIGGGSTEVIDLDGPRISFRTSLPIGAVRLSEETLQGDPPSAASLASARARIERMISDLPPAAAGCEVVGVGGTVTTLAAIAGAVEPYDARLIHGMELPLPVLDEMRQGLAAQRLHERCAVPGLPSDRAPFIVAGALLLSTLCRTCPGLGSVRVSDAGLRHGALLEHFGLRGFDGLVAPS